MDFAGAEIFDVETRQEHLLVVTNRATRVGTGDINPLNPLCSVEPLVVGDFFCAHGAAAIEVDRDGGFVLSARFTGLGGLARFIHVVIVSS